MPLSNQSGVTGAIVGHQSSEPCKRRKFKLYIVLQKRSPRSWPLYVAKYGFVEFLSCPG